MEKQKIPPGRSEQFQTTIKNYRKRHINVRENRRKIKKGQPRDTVNIDHT